MTLTNETIVRTGEQNRTSVRGLTAHFVPRWPKNPYHDELARHLQQEGVRVEPESELKSIYRGIRKSGIRPDIIHLHSPPLFSLGVVALGRFVLYWLRLLRLQREGVKVVWTVHNIEHHEAVWPRIDRWFSRWLYHQVDAVIVHTAAARRMVEAQWRVRRTHHVFVIHHGHFIDSYPPSLVRVDARAALKIPRGKWVILFLGSIRPYKGVTALIDVFKSASLDDAQLIVAGEALDIRLEREIQQAADGSPSVTFRPGYLAPEEVQLYLSAADIVVFPYTKALTSGALILAMSFGRPCIAPKMGALADTLDDKGGFLYSPDSPDGLRDSLIAASRQRHTLATMGAYNRRRAEQWDWTTVASQTRAVYTACLAPQRPA